MLIDCTLSNFKVPGFEDVIPLFGTKKPNGQSVLAREAHSNIAMPFALMRPHVVAESCSTSAIEVNSVFDLSVAGVTLEAGAAAYNGCTLHIINSSDGPSCVLVNETKTFEVPEGETLDLEYIGGRWREWKSGGKANHIVGEYRTLSFEPTPLEMAQWRLMPLQWQIVAVADYHDLFVRKWVGPELNDTALWWYRCDDDGTRNVDGEYIRVEDARGLFFRNAGANAILSAANNAPYDGGDVGKYQPEMLQAHTHSKSFLFANPGTQNADARFWAKINNQTNDASWTITFDLAGGKETRPVSIAVLVYVTY